MTMELRVLRYFLAVAREQNITAAAAKIHITQPTLSKQLMELEAELGTQLLIRGKRKVTLTEVRRVSTPASPRTGGFSRQNNS